MTLSDGAPSLPSTTRILAGRPVTADIQGHSFRLDAVPLDGGGWLVAGKSLAEQTHVEQVLLTGELIAGPVLLLAIYLGTLVIGLKAVGTNRTGPSASARVHSRRLP